SNLSYSCGLAAALAVIGGKWKFLILWTLATGGPQRFSALRRAIGEVSEKMLAQELKALEADGVNLRRDFHEGPPRVEYSLTRLGLELSEAVRPLCDWGGKHMKRIAALPSQQDR